MKIRVFTLGILALCTFAGIVAMSDVISADSNPTFDEATDKWRALNVQEVSNYLKGPNGDYLNHVTFDRNAIEEQFRANREPDIKFHLGLDEGGTLGVFTKSIKSQGKGGYDSRVQELTAGLADFDENAYEKRNDGFSDMSKEHIIGADLALTMIQDWQNAAETSRARAMIQEKGKLLRYLAYNRDAFRSVLKPSAVEKVTLFLAMNSDKELRFVAVGADSSGNLLLPGKENSSDDSFVLLDFSRPCPYYCDPPESSTSLESKGE